MSEQALNIEWLDPKDLVPYDKNAKLHPKEQIEGIKKQISAHGFDVPIVLWKDNIIIKGHGRTQAALELELPLVPCLRRLELTEAQARAARLADNKLAESGWAQDLLRAELAELSEMNIEVGLTGFPEIEVVNLTTDPEEHQDQSHEDEWRGMPEFEQNDLEPVRQMIVSFASEQDRTDFGQRIGQSFTPKTKSIWYPKAEIDSVKDIGYGAES